MKTREQHLQHALELIRGKCDPLVVGLTGYVHDIAKAALCTPAEEFVPVVPVVGPPDGYLRFKCGTLARPGMTVYDDNNTPYVISRFGEFPVGEGAIVVREGKQRHMLLSGLTTDPAPPPKPTAEDVMKRLVEWSDERPNSIGLMPIIEDARELLKGETL